MIENRPPLTSVLAPERSKKALTRALRKRRTFVSWNHNVHLRYSVNGYVMGSTIDDRTDDLAFRITIRTDPERPEERVRRIQILRDHPSDVNRVKPIAEADFDDTTVEWSPTINDFSGRYVLLRVYHQNDWNADGTFQKHGSTYAAPVWIDR